MRVLSISVVTWFFLFLAVVAGLSAPVASLIQSLVDPFRILRLRIWFHNLKKEPILFHDTREFACFMNLISQYCLETKAGSISAKSAGRDNYQIIYVESLWQISGMSICIWKSFRNNEIRMGVRLMRLTDNYFLIDETFHHREWCIKGPHLCEAEGKNFRRLLQIFDQTCKDYGMQC